MNQDDFRQILANRTPQSSTQSYGGKRSLTETDLVDMKKLLAKKGKKKSKKSMSAALPSGAEGKSHGLKSLYRDRAAERRIGSTGDMIDAEAFRHIDAEQSKFLGGDMEHTHLVKGLDHALLAQLKREKQKLLAAKMKKEDIGEAIGAKERKESKAGGGVLTFKTRMGRRVYFHACQSTFTPTASVKSDLFLPGRMYYTFPLSSTVESASVPVSVQRSKEDCPEPDDMVSGFVDESLIQRVKQVMISQKQGNKMRKKTKKTGAYDLPDENVSGSASDKEKNVVEEKIAESVGEAAIIIDDEEDIFPGVGEYVPIDQRIDDQLAASSNKEANGKLGYFENLSASITEKEGVARKKEEDAERSWKAAVQKAAEAQKKLERERVRKEKEAKMTGGADDYAEYQDIGVLGNSDEEDDEEIARRRKAAGITGSTGEADMKKKSRRKQQKQSSKFANDLEKVNKIMQEKPKVECNGSDALR
uniref:RED-like N-terminal domain-containing protein n=1 Tax=Hyaloperonospora arabidopsidis (strain Emoy2) TaxID=559515 RepID=M4BY95_HYAAE